MRVKLCSNPPLPPVRAWFPLADASTSTVSTFKSILCTSLPAFGGIVPLSLRLSIDGFELLDKSELSVVRDGDLISVDAREVPLENATTRLDLARKRKRMRTPSVCESDTESTSSSGSSSSDTSESSTSDSQLQARALAVPPGHGKPQTRARNLRRRLKRMHERGPVSGPVSGANAVGHEPEEATGQDEAPLMSLSLRNKNKAKNFRSLLSRPLPAKIIFGEQEVSTRPRLVPPSERGSLPANVLVTRVDVESKTRDLEIENDPEWEMLERVTRDNVTEASVVGYKALGIDPVTRTPGQVLTVGRVASCGSAGLVMREGEEHPWEDIERGDWRVLN